MRLHTNGNQELQYQPGDHLGVFPGNHEDLVNALIERLEDAPPANHVVKVEMLEERNTALGEASGCTARKASAPSGQGLPGMTGLSVRASYLTPANKCVNNSLLPSFPSFFLSPSLSPFLSSGKIFV